MRLKLIHQDSVNLDRSIKESEIVVTLGVSKVSVKQLHLEFGAAVGNGKKSRLEVNFIYDCYLTLEESRVNPRKIIEEYIEEITKHTLPIISSIDKSMEEIDYDLVYDDEKELEESTLLC